MPLRLLLARWKLGLDEGARQGEALAWSVHLLLIARLFFPLRNLGALNQTDFDSFYKGFAIIRRRGDEGERTRN